LSYSNIDFIKFVSYHFGSNDDHVRLIFSYQDSHLSSVYLTISH